MIDGIAFLPIPDLTNGVHLLRTLCPDDPPDAAELLDYFDSSYVSGTSTAERRPEPSSQISPPTQPTHVSTSNLECPRCYS